MLLATKQAKFADFICWQSVSFKIKELNFKKLRVKMSVSYNQ